MSGECEKCWEHCLDCKCPIPLGDGENPPAEQIPVRYVNVRGREEHEAIIKDSKKCEELGLDQYYEIMVYLKRWGNWLDKTTEKNAKNHKFRIL